MKKTVLALLLCMLCGPATAIELLDPRLAVVNQFSVPEPLALPIGDLAFSDDGSTAFFIDASGGASSAVWQATVERGSSGSVTGFSSFIKIFSDEDIDTGLTFAPGTQTFFYRTQSIGVSQRLTSGVIEDYEITSYGASSGGLAFVPGAFSVGGDIVSSSCDNVYRHSVSPDGDGSFTIGTGTIYAEYSFSALGLCIGDMEFVMAGWLGPALLFAIPAAGTSLAEVWSIELDPVTGEPADGATTNPVGLVDFEADAAWGLAIDPVTGHLFVVERDGASPTIHQISLNRVFQDRFEQP